MKKASVYSRHISTNLVHLFVSRMFLFLFSLSVFFPHIFEHLPHLEFLCDCMTVSTAPKVQRFLKLYVYRCTNDTVAERRRRGCPCRGAPEAGCDLPLGLGWRVRARAIWLGLSLRLGLGLGHPGLGLGLGIPDPDALTPEAGCDLPLAECEEPGRERRRCFWLG